MKTITVDEFVQYFAKHYPYIQHSQSRKEIYEFLKRQNFKGASITKAADQFSDLLLSQGLADVQE